MSKIITAWVNGAVQSIEVADTAYVAPAPTIEDRVAALEQQRTLDVVTKTVSLPVANWVGDTSPYSQVVEIADITEKSKVDLQPTVEQLRMLQGYEISLIAVNDNGVITVYALNYKPTVDLEMQALITEVN